MRSILIPLIGIATLLFSDLCADGARAELRTDGTLRIEWEVKNRFRLFRHEADFQRHVAAAHGDGVLAAERRLARATDGRGWARDGGLHLHREYGRHRARLLPLRQVIPTPG